MISEIEIKGFNPATGAIFLDPKRNSPRAQEFAEGLRARIVGQERAVRQMSNLYQVLLAGMNSLNRPIGTMLFLGPTGSGKTRAIAQLVADVPDSAAESEDEKPPFGGFAIPIRPAQAATSIFGCA